MRSINEQMGLPITPNATFQQELYSEVPDMDMGIQHPPLRNIYSGRIERYSSFNGQENSVGKMAIVIIGGLLLLTVGLKVIKEI